MYRFATEQSVFSCQSSWYGKGGYVAHVNASANYDASFIDGTQGGWNQGARRSKDYRGIKLGWGGLIGIASPNRTETPSECLADLIPRPGKRKDLALLEARRPAQRCGRRRQSHKSQAAVHRRPSEESGAPD